MTVIGKAMGHAVFGTMLSIIPFFQAEERFEITDSCL